MGMPAREFVSADDLREVWGLAEGHTEPTALGDFRLRNRERGEIWVSATAAPLTSADGSVRGYLVMLTDVSERHSMEERLRELNATLRGMVDRDGLTGVLNRRALEHVLADPPVHARGMGVLLIDVDHFKDFNDTRGHQAGDDALRHMTRLLSAELRDRDRVFRYGGEEFVVLLDDIDRDAAKRAAERLRHQVDSAGAPATAGAPRGLPTISVGVATGSFDEPGALLGLIEAADAALYAAKAGGRNRVVLATHGIVDATWPGSSARAAELAAAAITLARPGRLHP
jgi:diguanylate cyclase (GGDEF)-like protein